ncbi:DUF1460 domain-containing protein [Marinomonas ostreistagni]|nr:DUF1460 domain-containing protein [Marinomonas ostreistagni]
MQLPNSSPEQQAQALQQLRQAGAHFAPEPVNTPYIPLTAIFVPQQADPAKIPARQQASQAIEQDNTLNDKTRQQALQQLALTTRQQDAHLNQTLLDRIPSGSVISIVRPNYEVKQWIGTNMNITHQAIAVRRDGQLYLRHASQLKRQVIEQDFVDYFSHYLLSASVKGFNIQVIRPEALAR